MSTEPSHTSRKSNQLVHLSPRDINRLVKGRARETLQNRVDTNNISPIWFRYYYENTSSQSFRALLHPKILERCNELFEDGHFENAVFDAMKVIEEEIRKKINSPNADIGVNLISIAMGGSSPKISFSVDSREQESAFALFRGAIGYYKNPSSHRFVDNTDHVKALECLAFASLLMRMLDEVR